MLDLQNIIIAIDGHSSCGKSTLAKAMARELGYIYVDSGAMYRAITYYFLENQIDLKDEEAIRLALNQMEISFANTSQGNRTILNGQDIEEEIRKMRVSEMVSPVAAISAVRREMVRQQQAMGQFKGIVMDGRDIGTVVFPDAELKIFLTADTDIRAQRRTDELSAKGQAVDFEAVKANLINRDRIDSTREDSPLRQAKDAIVIDNTHLTPEQQLERALALVEMRVS